MTHNEIAILIVKAIHQEEGRMPDAWCDELRKDFRHWDDTDEPTVRLISALKNYVTERLDVAEYNRLISALDILGKKLDNDLDKYDEKIRMALNP